MGKFASLDIPQSVVCLFLMFLPHLKLHAVEFNLFRNKTHYHHQSGHDLAHVLLFLLFFPQNPSSPLRHPLQYIKFISSHNCVALKMFSSFSSFFYEALYFKELSVLLFVNIVFFIAAIYSILYIFYILFCSPSDGHIGYLQPCAPTSHFAMNTA